MYNLYPIPPNLKMLKLKNKTYTLKGSKVYYNHEKLRYTKTYHKLNNFCNLELSKFGLSDRQKKKKTSLFNIHSLVIQGNK